MNPFEKDDFLPDLEEKEFKHLNQLESTLMVPKKPDNMLKHDEEIGGVIYKYDLPVENTAIVFKSQIVTKQDITTTPT
jgi:hypothetical protein